ncbi:hypothetical protein ACEPAH_9436 [Sanghuangporus vaninii]
MCERPAPWLKLCSESLPKPGPLPDLLCTISIPQLEDKPQNPIISTLERSRVRERLSSASTYKEEIVSPNLDNDNENPKEVSKDIWLEVRSNKFKPKSCLVSWDTLRDTRFCPKYPSPFVSEQAPDVSIAARDTSRLLASVTEQKTISITVAELFEELGLILVGCASTLHEWRSTEERFVLAGSSGIKLSVMIDGMDDVVSQSYISSFADFGTLYRRLDMLVLDLRRTTRQDSSAAFTFAHCLSSALEWIRREVTYVLSSSDNMVCDVWTSFQEVQSVLSVLASLCSRDIHLNPHSYQALPRTPQQLLSHIYDFLCLQVERQTSRLVRAVLAYILTVTSRPYFHTLAGSIGLGNIDDMLADARRKAARSRDDGILVDEEDDEEEMDSELESENDLKETFPSFVSEEVKDAIIRARRSVRILSSPEFEGGQRIDLPKFRKLEWIWADDEISRRALEEEYDGPELDVTEAQHPVAGQNQIAPIHKYKPELAGLAVCDLEPDSLSYDSDASLINFITAFPTYPPVLTPTLPLLSDNILSPIVAQARSLGRAALQHFLTPGTSLHLRAHLVLLRAYLLLSAPSFKARLAAALFSDSCEDEEEDEGGYENPMAITIRTRARNANSREMRRKRSERNLSQNPADRLWPVGLAFGLTRQAEWPPKSSELSFYLRRVIMDSLEHVRESENMFEDELHNDELGDDEFWDEGESRIGFAIRDLPMGSGGERWLDPTRKLYMSFFRVALDFLYMQYKPPNPLRCLITEDILSKYQRIFAFLLRLLRVEAAMRAVFRVTRRCSIGHVFANYPNAQNLVLHFRFAAQAFLTAFSAYVADTAIRGNIDPFIACVRYAEVAATSPSEYIGPFADVYALMQRHSRVLDSVLAACLLRGAQRTVGDILRTLLEVILEFSVLVGNAYRVEVSGIRNRAFDEERAARRVEALFAKFCKTRYALVKALRKIAERGSKPFTKESAGPSREKLPPSSGGMEALIDLLLRIGDANDGKN